MVELKGSMSVERSFALKDELAEALAGGDTVVIDVSSIEELDLSCLQVLYSASASAKAAGKKLHFSGTLPPRVSERLMSCGFLRGAESRRQDLESALVGF
jgi:anti-anti-sigma regulatory factor